MVQHIVSHFSVRRSLLHATLLLLVLCSVRGHAQVFPSFGDERAGTSIANALKLGLGARAAAMGEAFTAIADDATALYWNPAGLTNTTTHEAHFSHTTWFGGITQSAGAATMRINDEHIVGISLAQTGLPAIAVTTETHPFGTGQTFQFGDFMAALSYAHRFTDQFSAGVTVRYIHETLGDVALNAFTVDAGTFYWTGLGTTRFAVAISNFSNQKEPEGTVTLYDRSKISGFRGFDAPTVFRIGFAMEPILDSTNRFTVALQLNHPSDNAENYALGGEYALTFSDAFPAQILARAGYKLNVEEENASAGAGVRIPVFNDYRIAVDYAWTNFRALGAVHRISAGIQF